MGRPSNFIFDHIAPQFDSSDEFTIANVFLIFDEGNSVVVVVVIKDELLLIFLREAFAIAVFVFAVEMSDEFIVTGLGISARSAVFPQHLWYLYLVGRISVI